MAVSPFSRLSTIVLLLAVAGIGTAWAAGGGRMFSPGALHAGDASRERYGGVTSHAELKGDCGACHAVIGSARPMAVRCLECHTDVQRDLRDTSSLHGALTAPKQCMACHTEHKGATAELTNLEGFGPAHGQLGFSLEAHRKLADGSRFTCRSCHGATSFKFAAGDCESCHRDYQPVFVTKHVAAWGSDCQSCHDGADRFSRGRFDHASTRYPLTGAHVKATCVACHTNVRQLTGYKLASSECIACHLSDDKHRGSLGRDCASCHTTESWEGARFDHDVFPLDHGARSASPCKTCHLDAKNYKSYTCYGCHEHTPARVQAQHRGEVRTQNLDDCVECHAGGRGEGGEGRERGEGGEHEGRRRRER